MKVLVAGGVGFIGSHVVDLLLQRGYEVRILDGLFLPIHLNGKKSSHFLAFNIVLAHRHLVPGALIVNQRNGINFALLLQRETFFFKSISGQRG